MNCRKLLTIVPLALGFALSVGSAQAADISEITAKDYYGATYFKTAQEHPKVAKRKRSRQIKMVARDLGWRKRKLKAAIAKLDKLDGDPIEMAKSAIEAGFAKTRVSGRVLDVLINAEEPKHVVVYVRWQATKKQDAIKDASTIANVIATSAPLVSTLSLSAIHPKAKKSSKVSVWSAKIGREAMLRIDQKRIDGDYAERLYARLFEGVKSRPF